METLEKVFAIWIAAKGNLSAEETGKVQATFAPTHGKLDPANLLHLSRVQNDLQALAAWFDLEDALSARTVDAKTRDALLNLERMHRRSGNIELADVYQGLRLEVASITEKDATSPITVEETDDPMHFLRQGQIAEDLKNCFRSDGNPNFNQYIVTTLGTPGMKLLIARDEKGEPIGIAMMKVKQLPNRSPILFLEHGIYRAGRSSVRKVMEALVLQKAKALSEKTGITTHAYTEGTGSPEDVKVEGIGAYTEDEYVESVFGWRRSSHIRHSGRRIIR